ncbi:hypothetical protein DFA_09674 [Cavenderia fasciculata]|uniref:F-box domain-containing protein n=1 Tax=Cavenderia fasciculata TaxID=261658 RepID=F4Q8A2_CACFS|nr:uncharacterized protein DFA_09674 [Cavenderia fasciculata]EGG16002.1 hypothetical protein DFA_09674 [Cavenderia fasciculata]|eukprot:XP_004352327.1 hypothetical protein DFA_09674 [Cavenderia fasciculata]
MNVVVSVIVVRRRRTIIIMIQNYGTIPTNQQQQQNNNSNQSIPTASLNANSITNFSSSSSAGSSSSSSLSSSWNSNSSGGSIMMLDGNINSGCPNPLLLINSSNNNNKKKLDGKDRKKKKREKRKKQSTISVTIDNPLHIGIEDGSSFSSNNNQQLLLSPQQESQRGSGSNLLVEYSPTLVGVQVNRPPPSPSSSSNNNNIISSSSLSALNTPSPSSFSYRGIHHPICPCSTLHQQQNKLLLLQQQQLQQIASEDDDFEDDDQDEDDDDDDLDDCGGDIDEEMAEDEMEPNRYSVGDQMDIDPIDSWYNGDPLVSEVLKDERETISNVEMRSSELEAVERTIKQLTETKQAIERDIRLHKLQLRTVQRKKNEYIKTIANSYISIAIRYNLAKNESRCLTLILPDEVMLHIFCFLTPMDLCSGVCRVSRKWRSLAFDISLWRDICLQRRLLDGSSFFDAPPPKSGSIGSGGGGGNSLFIHKKSMECDEKASSSSSSSNSPSLCPSPSTTLLSSPLSTTTSTTTTTTTTFDQQSPQISYGGSVWGDNWYVGEFRKDSNWRRGKYRTTVLRGHKEIGNKLLSGSTDSTIRLWDLKNGTHVNTIKGQSAVCCLKFTDSKLITGYEDSTIKIFDFSY